MTNLKYDLGMKLKYNLIALFFFGGLLAACDPMEDIYNEIDSEGITITKTEEEYILVKADYESIAKAAEADAQTDEEKALAKQVASDLALNSFASAEKYVPAILANMYGSWGKGSTVGVTYNYQEDTSETLKKFSVVSAYTLSGDDYKTIWGNNFLSPSHAPNVEIPKILATRMEDAKEGDFCLVDYMYDLNDPVEGTDYLSENFNSCTAKQPIEIEGWKQISVKGTEQWSANVYKGDGAAELSAYKADGELENYLITKPVKIESADALLTFDIVFGHYNGDAFSVLISDTYNAGEAFDVSAWTDITDYFTYPVPMESGYTDKTNVGTYSLKSFNGKNIYVAFRYRGAKGGITTTIQLDNVKITTSQPTQQKPYNSLFQFINGKWGAYLGNDILVVTPSDYDAKGEPLIGVSILEVGTTNGTITDIDGNFTLSVNEGATLEISYIGYVSQEVSAKNQNGAKIVLKEDTETLDEVVVIGYGAVRKADVAGAVAVLDNKSFKDQPITQVSDALQGRVSGVQVENSGVPGGSVKIRVRGSGSINKSNDPLYVVDGIVRESGLDGINPEDIQSMQVLKDASSTAIYGSRGSNGVVLVTTKTGLADYLNADRSALSNELSKLQKEGVLSYKKNTFSLKY